LLCVEKSAKLFAGDCSFVSECNFDPCQLGQKHMAIFLISKKAIHDEFDDLMNTSDCTSKTHFAIVFLRAVGAISMAPIMNAFQELLGGFSGPKFLRTAIGIDLEAHIHNRALRLGNEADQVPYSSVWTQRNALAEYFSRTCQTFAGSMPQQA
jgi:hypothetical protein